MKHRFLLHSLNHRIVIVDISSLDLGSTVDRGSVPFIWAASWNEVARYLKNLQASDELIEHTRQSLQEQNTAVVTIAE